MWQLNKPLRSIFNAATVAGLLALPMLGAFPVAEAATIMTKGTENLAIETGKGVLVRLDRPAKDIFIANPAIADVQVKSPRVFYVFGLNEGETSLYAMDSKENVIYSANITVSKNIASTEEALARLFPDASIHVESVNGMYALTGHVTSPDEAETAERMFMQLAGVKNNIINRLEISTPTQVNLRVKFAEVGRGLMKTLGFNWENAYLGDNLFVGAFTGRDVVKDILDPITNLPIREFATSSAADGIAARFTSGRFDFNTVIDALETDGYLSVLAEPNLTAMSGETASFLAGGEFPIPVPGGESNNTTVQFKPYGVGLSFTPRVLSENKINLKVAPEVSQITNTGAVSINGVSVPALSTRRASTTVELASGQSFAIAGLLQNTMTKDNSKTPGLGDLPILGALFKSERFQRQETELVIIVTPYIVRPISNRDIVLPTDGVNTPADPGRLLGTARTPSTLGNSTLNTPPAQTPPSRKTGAGFRIGN